MHGYNHDVLYALTSYIFLPLMWQYAGYKFKRSYNY